MAIRNPTAAAGTTLSSCTSPASSGTIARLLEAVGIVEVDRDLLLAEGECGSRRIALEGEISNLYTASEDLSRASGTP